MYAMPWVACVKPMTFIARILRFLFWVVIVSWSVSLLRRVVNNMGASASGRQEPIDVPSDAVSRKLVRDPVCGMHLAEGLAIAERSSAGEPVYFCSEECRNKFMDAPKKFAANA